MHGVSPSGLIFAASRSEEPGHGPTAKTQGTNGWGHRVFTLSLTTITEFIKNFIYFPP